MQIAEVIVVEGEHDRDRVLKAVQADIIVTGGAHIHQDVFLQLERAASIRGLIILTDPDHAGELIRRQLEKRFPGSKHAYLSRQKALKNGDIGIENAAPEDIAVALSKVRAQSVEPNVVFTHKDMLMYGLVGEPESAKRREELGALLRIGYANAKSFLKRLNALRVTKEEFERALEIISTGGAP